MVEAASARHMPARHVPCHTPDNFSWNTARAAAALAAVALLLAGCGGMQSTFHAASVEAGAIAVLFRVMAIGALVTWLLVMGCTVYATLLRTRSHNERVARRLIVAGGVLFPVVVLTALLAYGLALMPALRPALPEGSLRIAVSGEQWWWRVRYLPAEGAPVALANEIRLPLGESVEFRLSSPDVVHSFWIPALGGKVDMTPGRTTTLVVTPTRTGTFRGACAEYCGASHARMNFLVQVMAPDAFRTWLVSQSEDAVRPQDALAARGAQAFLSNGCGACHAIRGTAADGSAGPDLTHVGSRLSLAAGTLPNDVDAFRRWIVSTGTIKPEVHMPAFAMLPDDDIEAIAVYLDGLQ